MANFSLSNNDYLTYWFVSMLNKIIFDQKKNINNA